MSKPLVLGLGPHDAGRTRQVHFVPPVHRLLPLPTLLADDDIHLRGGLRADLADPDAHQCCWWWDGE
jgi:hypothetical protein